MPTISLHSVASLTDGSTPHASNWVRSRPSLLDMA
jgi:hypothetical protein